MKKILDKVKQTFCNHSFGAPQVVYDDKEYKPGFVQHPIEKELQLPVLKREFKVVRTCKHCGKQQIDIGYDTIDVPEEGTLSERADIIAFRKKLKEREKNPPNTRFRK